MFLIYREWRFINCLDTSKDVEKSWQFKQTLALVRQILEKKEQNLNHK